MQGPSATVGGKALGGGRLPFFHTWCHVCMGVRGGISGTVAYQCRPADVQGLGSVCAPWRGQPCALAPHLERH